MNLTQPELLISTYAKLRNSSLSRDVMCALSSTFPSEHLANGLYPFELIRDYIEENTNRHGDC